MIDTAEDPMVNERCILLPNVAIIGSLFNTVSTIDGGIVVFPGLFATPYSGNNY